MAAKNDTQDENITKLDLPVGTIMAYAPNSTLGNVATKTSIRGILRDKGWAVCDHNSSINKAAYKNMNIPNLTDRFLKGHNFADAAPALDKRLGKSSTNDMNIADGQITLTIGQMPKHDHDYVDTVIGLGSCASGGAHCNQAMTRTTDPAGESKPIDIRPPFYSVVYIMKFQSVI